MIKDKITIFLVGLLPLVLRSSMRGDWGQDTKIKVQNQKNVFFGFLKVFSIIALAVILVGIFTSPLIGHRKWIPYLSLLIPSLILSFNYFKTEFFNKKSFSIIAGFVFLIVGIFGVFTYKDSSWFGISGLLISCCYLLSIPLRNYKYFYFVSIGVFIFLFNINSIIFLNNYKGHYYIWTVFITLAVVWAFFSSLFRQDRLSRWNGINKIGLVILLIISLLFAFRSDSMFPGSAEYHWSYFTGVIQAIRSGGELLWSAPSQYGFLNVLLPSFLPWSSRSSFFIFQTALFFISTVIIIKTLYEVFKHKAAFIVMSLTALSLFYLADPELIGPTLYPSSSAVRFFCVYVLLFAILREYRKGTILSSGIKRLVTAAYILGALWSAESFLYCSAIYGTYLLFSAISMSKLKLKPHLIFNFLIKNIFIVIASFIIFNLCYLAVTSHFPDWSMYLMYAFGYAIGFGEIPIVSFGIHWAIIIVLSCIIFISSRLYSAKKYSEWIVVSVCFISLWVLTSYYVGRAASNNLTALLPEIFYIFTILSLMLMDSKFLTYRILLAAVFLPWIVVGVIGGIGNPHFVKKMLEFRVAENIDSKGFRPDKNLSGIFKSLKVSKETRIVYYWDLNANPVISNGKGGYVDPLVGMPVPLALLEEPVLQGQRDIIMERFLSTINEPVFLIHRKDQKIDRFLVWKKFFEKKYSIKEEDHKNKTYEVFIVRHK
jgi:hypothetical protein